MNISELPDGLRQIALFRRQEYQLHLRKLGHTCKVTCNSIAQAFVWEDTPEGARFWDSVHEADGATRKEKIKQIGWELAIDKSELQKIPQTVTRKPNNND